MSPVATEFLFALGLGEKLVGVTTYCDRPVEAKKLAKIGGFSDPQLESIIKLKPGLVVANPFGNANKVIAALKSRNIQTLSVPVETLADMKLFLSSLAEVTDTKERAKLLQSKFDTQFLALKGNLDRQKLRVLWLVGSTPLIAAGPSTFPGEILLHLGMKNVVETLTPAWPMISLEALLRDPPNLVVLSDGSSAEVAQKSLSALFSKHPTVRLLAPKKSLLQRPGPYLIEEIHDLMKELKKLHV